MKPKITIADRSGRPFRIIDFEWLDYSFECSMDELTGVFNITYIDEMRGITVRPGFYILFNLGNQKIFSGLIQKVEKTVNKNERTVKLSGKDLSSVLVESYCLAFPDYNNWYPYSIVNDLVSQTNFLIQAQTAVSIDSDTAIDDAASIEELEDILTDRKYEELPPFGQSYIEYDDDFTELAARESFKINIGDKVYDKISELVQSTGNNCLFSPDTGILYIGNLENKRKKDGLIFEIYNNLPESFISGKNNVLSAIYSSDESNIYAAVTVYTQKQNGKNYTGTYKNHYIMEETLRKKKLMVIEADNESNPKKLAWQIIEDQIIEGDKLRYELSDHSQNGKIFRVNSSVRISDDISGIKNYANEVGWSKEMVISNCTYIYNQNDGMKTILEISATRDPYDPS